MRERRRRKNMAKNEKTSISLAYQLFVNDKKTDNLSKATLSTYDLHIRYFINSLDLQDTNCSFLNDSNMYQEFVEELQEDGNKKDVTVTSYCRSVRAFLYWLQDNEYCDPYPLKLPKYQHTIKKTYDADELAVLLKKPKDCTEVEYQTWVFINFVCATGIRLSSALNVKVNDISRKEKTVYIQCTKNNKAQSLFLNDNMLSILNKYIIAFELELDDYLFCTAEKTKLAKRSVQDNVATYNRKLGLKKTSIHLMRHTFAKNYYLQTKDIYTLCQILGHSTISTTEQYLKDLGVSLADGTAYNPQSLFAKETTKKKRRGKMSVR